MDHAVKILFDYLWMFRDFEKYDAPKDSEDDFDNHPLFCLALQQKSYIEYLLDELMADAAKLVVEHPSWFDGKKVDEVAY